MKYFLCNIIILFALFSASVSFAVEIVRFPNLEEIKNALNKNNDKILIKNYEFSLEKLGDLPRNLCAKVAMPFEATTQVATSPYYFQDGSKDYFWDQFSITAPFICSNADGYGSQVTLKISIKLKREGNKRVPHEKKGYLARSIENDVFRQTDLPYGIEVVLNKFQAINKPPKAVWLLRESVSNPGSLVVSYYDKTSESPTGFVNKIFVLFNNNWTPLTENLRRSFTPVYPKYFQNVASMTNLYDELLKDGFKREGQIFPRGQHQTMEYAIFQDDVNFSKDTKFRYQPNYASRPIDETTLIVYCMRLAEGSDKRGYAYNLDKRLEKTLIEESKVYFQQNPNKKYFNKSISEKIICSVALDNT